MTLFSNQKSPCALIGMIHLGALPGTPGNCKPVSQIMEEAMFDAQALVDGGCDALLIENT